MGEAGARRAHEVFGLDRMAVATRAVYDEVMWSTRQTGC
jgi:hypothetical protein